MRVCIECYKKIYKNRSQIISISEEKCICENCGKESFIVTNDYPGFLIMNKSPDFFYYKKG